MLKKAHKDSLPVVATLLHNRNYFGYILSIGKWGKSSTSLQNPHPVLIEGWVDDVLGECRVQLGIDAYYRDSYLDECEEEIQVDNSSWILNYGDHVRICVKRLFGKDFISIPKQSSNEIITVFYDASDKPLHLDCGYHVVFLINRCR